MNHGILIYIRYIDGDEVTLFNVTEIHYGYDSALGPNQIAYESDIHRQGFTLNFGLVSEFETRPAHKRYDQFELAGKHHDHADREESEHESQQA